MFDIAQKFLRGCGWFALIVGGLAGAGFGLLTQHESAVLEPQVSRELFTHALLGRLPTMLVAAFRATLEEVIEADVILHVRDVSHEDTEAQSHDVEGQPTLSQLVPRTQLP